MGSKCGSEKKKDNPGCGTESKTKEKEKSKKSPCCR